MNDLDNGMAWVLGEARRELLARGITAQLTWQSSDRAFDRVERLLEASSHNATRRVTFSEDELEDSAEDQELRERLRARIIGLVQELAE